WRGMRSCVYPCALSAPETPHVRSAPRPRRARHPQPAVHADLFLALVAAAAVPRPDPGPGRVRRALHEGAVAPGAWRDRAERATDHARGAGPDRRGDDLQPAGDGDRRRLRDLRLAPAPGRPPGPAGVAEPRQ